MKDVILNRVNVMGYLRENNLQQVANKNGGKTIQGSIIVAFDNLNSLRIDVYAEEKSAKKGTENKAYNSLLNFLPNRVTSIKSRLEADESATYDSVINTVTKVYAHCEFREYAVRDENGKESSRTKVQLLNWFDSIHAPKADKAFVPEASFEVDCYIEKMTPEFSVVNAGEDPEETGRYLLTALTPSFTGAMQRIEFVTGTNLAYPDDPSKKETVSDLIHDNWNVGESVRMRGVVYNLMTKKEGSKTQQGFGQPATTTIITTFKEERVIRGGDLHSVDGNEMGMEKAGFTSEEVKQGLLLREETVRKNTEVRLSKGTGTTNGATVQPSKNFGFGEANSFAGQTNENFGSAFDPKGF